MSVAFPPAAEPARRTRESGARIFSDAPRVGGQNGNANPPLVSIVTLVLWTGCLAVGVLGFVLPYARPHPPVPHPAPVIAEKINVELTTDPVPPPEPEPQTNPQTPPPLLDPLTAPKAPPRVAVAEPSPAIAFALPVEGPVRVVPAAQASHAQVTAPAVTAPGPVAPQTLVFGQGDGKQPAPEYPRQARREGQEGTVGIRFSLDETGRVLAAEVATASPWPLLNEAAVRTVRDRWHFRSGARRVFEVAIRFELSK